MFPYSMFLWVLWRAGRRGLLVGTGLVGCRVAQADAQRPGRVELSVFPLAVPLLSPASAAADAVLFGGFVGTTGTSDF